MLQNCFFDNSNSKILKLLNVKSLTTLVIQSINCYNTSSLHKKSKTTKIISLTNKYTKIKILSYRVLYILKLELFSSFKNNTYNVYRSFFTRLR